MGTRVYHYSEQYAKARIEGTARVIGWEIMGPTQHLEYYVERDEAIGRSRHTHWDADRTYVAEEQNSG